MLNSWTKSFLKNPLALMREVSVSPPHGYISRTKQYVDERGYNRSDIYRGFSQGQSIDLSGRNLQYFRSTDRDKVGGANGEYKVGTVEVPIGWMKLEPVTTDPRLAGALSFSIEMADQAEIRNELQTQSAMHAAAYERAALRGRQHELAAPSWEYKERIPIYFLPWDSKYLLKMNIPDYKENDIVSYGGGLEIDPLSPHLFFTAAINGCSVFITGNSNRPTVAHAGISQGSTPYGNDASAFWRDLITAHQMQAGSRGDRTYEVNNSMYVNNTGVSGGNRTINSDRYKSYLDNLPSVGSMKVEEVKPWGAVFGIRYGRAWSFYLQENATVMRYQVKKVMKTHNVSRLVQDRNIFGKKKSTYTLKNFDIEIEEDQRDYRICNVPMRVSPFFPEGPKQVKFEPNFRKVI